MGLFDATHVGSINRFQEMFWCSETGTRITITQSKNKIKLSKALELLPFWREWKEWLLHCFPFLVQYLEVQRLWCLRTKAYSNNNRIHWCANHRGPPIQICCQAALFFWIAPSKLYNRRRTIKCNAQSRWREKGKKGLNKEDATKLYPPRCWECNLSRPKQNRVQVLGAQIKYNHQSKTITSNHKKSNKEKQNDKWTNVKPNSTILTSILPIPLEPIYPTDKKIHSVVTPTIHPHEIQPLHTQTPKTMCKVAITIGYERALQFKWIWS